MSDPVKPLILIVDDVPTSIKMLGKSLQDEFTVITATSGEECLRQVRKKPQPDLILLDMLMAEMDGVEVCQRIKADAHTADIPIIFLTAMDDHINEEVGLKAGAVDYITKPFSLAIVKARINIHLELRQHREFVDRTLSSVTKVVEVGPHDPDKRTSRRVDPKKEDPTIPTARAHKSCRWNDQPFPPGAKISRDGVVYQCIHSCWMQQEDS